MQQDGLRYRKQRREGYAMSVLHSPEGDYIDEIIQFGEDGKAISRLRELSGWTRIAVQISAESGHVPVRVELEGPMPASATGATISEAAGRCLESIPADRGDG
jgi:hypothetical protein